jgi:hypothetical protein
VGPSSARLDVQTYDSGILKGIWEGTNAAGIYCAHPRVVVQAGYMNNVGIVQRQDKWGIWIHRRKHLHRLLERMLVHQRHTKRRNDALTALRATQSRT